MEYKLQEIDDVIKSQMKTLNKDIYLEKKPNGTWDIDFIDGDLHEAKYLESLQNAIIIACLTSWNYLNRYGNPTYAVFGNKAYLQLKQNKSDMNKYKIKIYFEECLKRMRRVFSVNNVIVTDDKINPYKYNVWFEIISINDELVNGEFSIVNDITNADSYIEILNGLPFTYHDKSTIRFTLGLHTQEGEGLEDEFIHIFINGEHKQITKNTDDRGLVSISYYIDSDDEGSLKIGDKIKFSYYGSEYVNGFETQEYDIFESLRG